MLGGLRSTGLDFNVFLCPQGFFFMKRETRRYWRELAYYSSLGLQVAFSIFIGLAIGVYLDKRFDLTPWFTLIFLGLGIAAGFRNIGHAIRKIRRF